jgi:hypothetical protein
MAQIRYYFDEMMPRHVAQALEKRGIAVVMAVDVEMTGKDDVTGHLALATKQEAVMVTRDNPFATRSLSITPHHGVICWTGGQRDFSGMIRRLTKFAGQYTPDQVIDRVFWLK